MSTVTSPARARAPRIAAAAVEKARLTLVPARRLSAPRAPFVVLVLLILGAGVVGLLMFNTQMQQQSFYATKLQAQADDLTAQQQRLDMELDALRDPQSLAANAKELGMVAPPVPLFVNLGNGTVDGTPTPATSGDGISIKPAPPALPAPLVVKPIIVRVKAPPDNTQPPTGHASTPASTPTGTNGATADQGAPR